MTELAQAASGVLRLALASTAGTLRLSCLIAVSALAATIYTRYRKGG